MKAERRRSLRQIVTNSESGSRGPIVAANLVEDMSEVIDDRFLAEYQLPGDLGIGESLGYQAQHFHLASG